MQILTATLKDIVMYELQKNTSLKALSAFALCAVMKKMRMRPYGKGIGYTSKTFKQQSIDSTTALVSYKCTCTHTRTYTHISACTQTNTHNHTHTITHTHARTHIHAHTHIHKLTPGKSHTVGTPSLSLKGHPSM